MRHDIIIVGSGPAGSSTALHLAKLAPNLAQRTLVLERECHPRPKVCGGGILQDGEAILQRLELDLTCVPHVDVQETWFRFERRGFVLKRKPAAFRIVQRDAFDAWLVDAVRARGIAVREGTRVLQARSVGDAVEVVTDRESYRARAVVGADGSRSVVRRAVSGGSDRCLAMALEVRASPSSRTGSSAAVRGRADFELSPIARGVQGYVWSFPTQIGGRPARNWGIYDGHVHLGRPRANLKTVLREVLAREGTCLDGCDLEGHAIRWFDPRGIFAAPGIVLVGDAAGVDPILGEGISFALGYGELAALELKEAFARDDFSFSGYRDRILGHSMGHCLKRRVRVARLMYFIQSRSIQRLMWWRLGLLLRWYTESFLIDWAR